MSISHFVIGAVAVVSIGCVATLARHTNRSDRKQQEAIRFLNDHQDFKTGSQRQRLMYIQADDVVFECRHGDDTSAACDYVYAKWKATCAASDTDSLSQEC